MRASEEGVRTGSWYNGAGGEEVGCQRFGRKGEGAIATGLWNS